MDDYKPHVWKTTDFGKTWTKITEGLDSGTHAKVIREDPAKKGLLFLGTERGVMYSPDAGKSWSSLQLNLPTVPVHDLVVKDNDLVVGTHGRSIWILDDLTPVRERDAAKGKSAHLFPVNPATKWHARSMSPTAEFVPRVAGDNPDTGAVIWFQLGADFKGPVEIEILDPKGKVIAAAKGAWSGEEKPAAKDDKEGDAPKRKLEPRPGLNRFVWDLTHDGATVIRGAPVDTGNAGAGVPVAPGEYTVRLTAGNQKFTQLVFVKADPRWEAGTRKALVASLPCDPSVKELLAAKNVPEKYHPFVYEYFARLKVNEKLHDELAAQQALALRVRDNITQLSDAVARIRAIKKQIDLRKELLKDRDDAKALLKESEALAKKLDEVEGKLHNPKAQISYDIFAAKGGAMLYSQYAFLLANLTDGDGKPTIEQEYLADDLERELVALLGQFDALAKDDVGKLNASAKKLGVPELYVPPVKKSDAAKK
jgi:hypothetical protein